MPKKVAVLITHGFEDEEYLQTVQAFQQAHHQCIHLDQNAGSVVYGLRTKTAVTIDQSLAHININDFDVLLIPGGQSPMHLAQKPDAITFVQRCMQARKIILSVSSASLLLLKANVLTDRLITAHRPYAAALLQAGAHYYDAELVNDNNLLLSCRGGQDLQVFINECLDVFMSSEFYTVPHKPISQYWSVH